MIHDTLSLMTQDKILKHVANFCMMYWVPPKLRLRLFLHNIPLLGVLYFSMQFVNVI